MVVQADYLADVSKTDLMRVVVALATEVFEIRDRQLALEAMLYENGTDLSVLNAAVEPAAFAPARLAERDGFVARVFEALRQSADLR